MIITDIYLNYFIFQNNTWKLFKLFNTAFILSSQKDHLEIVKLLLEQKGIDIMKDKLHKNS